MKPALLHLLNFVMGFDDEDARIDFYELVLNNIKLDYDM